MAATPQYRQLEALLLFCKTALRSDPVLLAQLGDPDLIVATTAEHMPIKANQERLIWDTQLPVICCWEESSKPWWDGATWGEESSLSLVYAFGATIGSEDVPPEAWAQRVSKLVYWQLCQHLRTGRTLDPDVADPNDDDLITGAGIYALVPGACTRLAGDGFEGFEMSLTMKHIQPPYTAQDPPELTSVTVTTTDQDTTIGVIGVHNVT